MSKFQLGGIFLALFFWEKNVILLYTEATQYLYHLAIMETYNNRNFLCKSEKKNQQNNPKEPEISKTGKSLHKQTKPPSKQRQSRNQCGKAALGNSGTIQLSSARSLTWHTTAPLAGTVLPLPLLLLICTGKWENPARTRISGCIYPVALRH